ncbi:hypothetical protein BDN72DRAFT_673633 [Pluteus cervinus]|uniref:Uncharacterized protein n=1 Tax=Pluteus cervinus TaxID=181527 RepID=A0ACD3ASP5_9AGAR|nr:hypothetical protein BDN72DRAFT_673633 [Pluteus cervinus]
MGLLTTSVPPPLCPASRTAALAPSDTNTTPTHLDHHRTHRSKPLFDDQDLISVATDLFTLPTTPRRGTFGGPRPGSGPDSGKPPGNINDDISGRSGADLGDEYTSTSRPSSSRSQGSIDKEYRPHYHSKRPPPISITAKRPTTPSTPLPPLTPEQQRKAKALQIQRPRPQPISTVPLNDLDNLPDLSTSSVSSYPSSSSRSQGGHSLPVTPGSPNFLLSSSLGGQQQSQEQEQEQLDHNRHGDQHQHIVQAFDSTTTLPYPRHHPHHHSHSPIALPQFHLEPETPIDHHDIKGSSNAFDGTLTVPSLPSHHTHTHTTGTIGLATYADSSTYTLTGSDSSFEDNHPVHQHPYQRTPLPPPLQHQRLQQPSPPPSASASSSPFNVKKFSRLLPIGKSESKLNLQAQNQNQSQLLVVPPSPSPVQMDKESKRDRKKSKEKGGEKPPNRSNRHGGGQHPMPTMVWS